MHLTLFLLSFSRYRTFRTKKGIKARRSRLSLPVYQVALETIAIKIRDEESIKDITIREEPVKLSLFSDDMTCFMKDSSSYTNLFVTLKTFGECSGLKKIMKKPKS